MSRPVNIYQDFFIFRYYINNYEVFQDLMISILQKKGINNPRHKEAFLDFMSAVARFSKVQELIPKKKCWEDESVEKDDTMKELIFFYNSKPYVTANVFFWFNT